MSPGIQNGSFVTRARRSCSKHPRGVKFCTGFWGQVGAGRAKRGSQLSPGVSRQRVGRGLTEKDPCPMPWGSLTSLRL